MEDTQAFAHAVGVDDHFQSGSLQVRGHADGADRIQIGMCGRVVKVPLRAEEGLGPLRNRVAGAFGLSAPFDLLGPEGKPIITDADVARVLGGNGDASARGDALCAQHVAPTSSAAPLPEVVVDANEQALMDLERAHEQSGAMRWALLQKLIVGLRRQIAEVAAAIGESQRRVSVLDEQVLAERSARDASTALLRGDVRSLAAGLEEGLSRQRRTMRESLDQAMTTMQARVDSDARAHAAAIAAATEEMQREMRAMEHARLKAGDEALRCLEEVRQDLIKEASVREDTLQRCAKATAAVEARVVSEQDARRKAETDQREVVTSLSSKADERCSKHDSELSELRIVVDELRNLVGTESASRSEGLAEARMKLEKAEAALECKLSKHCEHIETRIRKDIGDGAIEPRVRAWLAEETAARRVAEERQRGLVVDLEASLQMEMTERCAGEERVSANVATVAAEVKSAERAAQAAAAAASAVDSAMDQLAQRLGAEECGRARDIVTLRGEHASLREALGAERQARVSGDEAISTSERANREAAAEEFRGWRAAHAEETREWARVLVDRLSADLRTERDAIVSDLRRDSSETSRTIASTLREEFTATFRRLESATTNLANDWAAGRKEDRLQLEAQGRAASDEVKAALLAHGELAEALKGEQRLLLKRLQTGFAEEGGQRDCIVGRVSAVESDVKRLREHLPIIFAAPSSFGASAGGDGNASGLAGIAGNGGLSCTKNVGVATSTSAISWSLDR
eukprot:TRINITY_DN56308_c0_g1_i1.p1 TRINITY_DN56308_c0_g1~~TRINITY_DN56308_c0_g1_i1.p1  ORF type:complete len:763 (+),score=149.67 TRINITY_DN56308_c0_g1_i1:48-2291(+)